jgi:hypothetical protein
MLFLALACAFAFCFRRAYMSSKLTDLPIRAPFLCDGAYVLLIFISEQFTEEQDVCPDQHSS